VSEGKKYVETKKKIDDALFSGDTSEIANILKGLQKDSKWLTDNAGVKKFIETLDKSK
jgi:hypothetical protein